MTALLVYCSGSIAKSRADVSKLLWTDVEREELVEGARPSRVTFLNPDDPLIDVSNTLGQFGRDMYQVMVATAVVVDGRQRRGIGVGVELAASAAMGTPVIAVVPPHTTYRRGRVEYREAVVENYVHPHLESLASAIVDSFADAGAALNELPQRRHVTVPDWLKSAIAAYEAEILPRDVRMQAALAQQDRPRLAQ